MLQEEEEEEEEDYDEQAPKKPRNTFLIEEAGKFDWCALFRITADVALACHNRGR